MDQKGVKQTSRSVRVENESGLHARAAALFAKKAARFRSHIVVRMGPLEANGKSIMSILTLGASQGSEVSISAKGKDAPRAVAELTALIEGRFGEM